MRLGQCDVLAGTELSGTAPDERHLFTIFSGWALRSHIFADGTRCILDVLLPGDLIGLPQVLLGRSTGVVTALTPLTVCVFEPQRLPPLIEQFPSLALSLLLGRVREEERSDVQRSLPGRLGAAQRAAYFLLELRERLVRRGLARGRTCAMPLHRGQLADALGMSRVHLIRSLRLLREQGLLDVGNQSMTIPSISRLVKFCGYAYKSDEPKPPIL